MRAGSMETLVITILKKIVLRRCPLSSGCKMDCLAAVLEVVGRYRFFLFGRMSDTQYCDNLHLFRQTKQFLERFHTTVYLTPFVDDMQLVHEVFQGYTVKPGSEAR